MPVTDAWPRFRPLTTKDAAVVGTSAQALVSASVSLANTSLITEAAKHSISVGASSRRPTGREGGAVALAELLKQPARRLRACCYAPVNKFGNEVDS